MSKIVKNLTFFFKKNWQKLSFFVNFVEKKVKFLTIFDIQMAVFRSVRSIPNLVILVNSNVNLPGLRLLVHMYTIHVLWSVHSPEWPLHLLHPSLHHQAVGQGKPLLYLRQRTCDVAKLGEKTPTWPSFKQVVARGVLGVLWHRDCDPCLIFMKNTLDQVSIYEGAFGKPVESIEFLYIMLKVNKKTTVMLDFVQRRAWQL